MSKPVIFAINNSPELTPHLKRLRLSGVLETLGIRNQQAIDEKWSFYRAGVLVYRHPMVGPLWPKARGPF